MITEDYVSFEVAKLLKEKGFNEHCWKLYELGDCDIPVLLNGFELSEESSFWNNKYLELYKKEHSYINDICSAPTHQMAISWLREVYGLHIWVEYSRFDFNKEHPYLWNIVETKIDGDYWEGTYNKFSKNAVESALNYALENLI